MKKMKLPKLNINSNQNGVMPSKKSSFKIYVFFGIIVYAIIVLLILHTKAYMINDFRLSTSEAFSYAVTALKTHPFTFAAVPTGCGSSIGIITIILFVALYYLYLEEAKYRHSMENATHGSSKFNDDLPSYNKRFSSPEGSANHTGNNNMILTNEVYLSMNTRQTRRNNNVLVIGGSGAGKSRYVVKPNLCEMPINTNFICTDPSGELLADTGAMLEGCGFDLKVFNLVDMRKSHHYNPLRYIETENDVLLLADCILQNTTDPKKQGGDDFWEKAQKLELQAFIFLLWLHGDELGLPRNFDSIMKLMRGCTVSENASSSTELSETDKYFSMVEFGYTIQNGKRILASKDMPVKESKTVNGITYVKGYGEDISVKQYKNFKMGAGKTLKNILISSMARLSSFDSQEIVDLTSTDDIDLKSIGDKKTALFVILPQEHDSFNFLAAMLYHQLFQTLYFHAENECQGNYIVKDKLGENVKVFPIPHNLPEIDDDVDNEEDIEISLSLTNNKESFIDKLKEKISVKKNQKKNKNNDDLKNTEEDEWRNAEANEEATRPDDSPGEIDDEKVKETAESYAEQLKKCKLTKKGSTFYIKCEIDGKEEIIETLKNEEYAFKRASALKECSVTRCGLYLPYHVRFMLDEFANIGQIPQFTKKLATMRKYEISSTVILQSITQLKEIYKDDWGSIVGNCDSFLFLGCPELETQEYVSKRLGKKTIRIRNSSISHGGKGGSSSSYQYQARELMLPEELGMMSDTECICLIRGVYPFRGPKYEYEKHPNYKYTADKDKKNLYKLKLKKYERPQIDESSPIISIEESRKSENKSNSGNYISGQSFNQNSNDIPEGMRMTDSNQFSNMPKNADYFDKLSESSAKVRENVDKAIQNNNNNNDVDKNIPALRLANSDDLNGLFGENHAVVVDDGLTIDKDDLFTVYDETPAPLDSSSTSLPTSFTA